MNTTNMIQKLAAVAIAALAFAFAPSARAAEVVASYRYPVYNVPGDPTSGVREWQEGVTNATVVSSSSSEVTWSAGWYAVTNDVTLSQGAVCNGDVHLILFDGVKLKATGVDRESGIGVSGDGNSLTIYGQVRSTGQLDTTGGQYGAGIGGGEDGAGSNITINGGTVTATGGRCGAGIGGGYFGVGQNITINGGTVTAAGGEDGAGIGGGYIGKAQNIAINGGTVTATGGDYASGIGRGGVGGSAGIYVSSSLYVLADVTNPPTASILHSPTEDIAEKLTERVGRAYRRYVRIGLVETPISTRPISVAHTTFSIYTNGVLSAEGQAWSNDYATVVYTADDGYAFAYGPTVTNVLDTTKEPAVNAGGVAPAAPDVALKCRVPVYRTLGEPTSGIDHWETRQVNFVAVTSSVSTVTWSAGWYAVTNDVTLSRGAVCKGDVHLILCDGKKLTVTRTTDGPGIGVSGGGNSFAIYEQSQGTGQLDATGGQYGAGIGGGEKGVGQNISINGGKVTATGGQYGAGIGGGDQGVGTNIVINGGTVTAKGGYDGAGIGGGHGFEGLNITVNGGVVTATGGDYAAGIGGGYFSTGQHITLNGGKVKANGGQYGVGIGNGAAGSSMGLVSSDIYVNRTTLAVKAGASSADTAIENDGKDLATKLADSSHRYVEVKAGGSIDVEATGPGTITVTPAAWSNETVTITLAPAAGCEYTPDSLKVVGSGGAVPVTEVTAGHTYTFMMPASMVDVSASFRLVPTSYLEPEYNTPGDPTSGIKEWNVGTNLQYTYVTSVLTTWGAAGQTNWYVVASNTTIASRITCVGDVRLILKDGYTLNAEAGITASTNTVGYLGFAVYAQSTDEATMGKLVATGAQSCEAGIGGYDGTGENITINGGTVESNGGDYAAGIGGGQVDGGIRQKGAGSNITINGGKVSATGGNYGAGIGGGYESAGSNITINGGTVTAKGDFNAAGIGGGSFGSGSHITVNDGKVTATGDQYGAGAGIGGGREGAGSNITISGGDVTATGGNYGAGIGGGYYGLGEHITISGGDVTAKGGRDGAGIGGGKNGAGSNITINGTAERSETAGGCKVTANGGSNGAGIGGGSNGAAQNIAINGGTVESNGGFQSAGIGSGVGGAAATNIYVDRTALAVKAGASSANTLIENDGGDLAEKLAGSSHRYAAVKAGGSIVAEATGPGTISVTPVAAWANERVTITLTPAAECEYTPDSLKVTDAAGNLVPVTEVTAGHTYTFMMPASMVDVSASFRLVPMSYLEPEYNTPGDPTSGIKEWNVGTNLQYTYVTSVLTTWGAAGQTNWYVVAGNVTIGGRITCVGDVRLILKDGATLTASKGITASTGTSETPIDYLGFTVYAQSTDEATMGKLVATGASSAAGIGGGQVDGGIRQKGAGSNITINGGTVTTTGGDHAAGIGGGWESAGSNITINGGKVTATASSSGAGIGGGNKGAAKNITINGGDVTAKGDFNAAGIGGGFSGEGSHITVNGGKATATGGQYGAGIGGGKYGAGSNITISGGTVTATGGEDGAGIGGGYSCNGQYITINGGTVKATGGEDGAGIGGGDGGTAINISINGGKVTATGGKYGAGIGGGDARAGQYITINGGTVESNGGFRSAGIGGGYGGAAENITINGGTVAANGGSMSAGIGSGNDGAAASNIFVDRTALAVKAGASSAGAAIANDGKDLATKLSGSSHRYAEVKAGGSIDRGAKGPGTVSAPVAAWSNERVTITLTPSVWCVGLTVAKADDPTTTVEVTPTATGGTFTMLGFAVTVTATFADWVEVQPSAAANTTVSGVYTNGAAVALVGGRYGVATNATVDVVFRGDAGYIFQTGGTCAVLATNTVTASSNPTAVPGPAAVPGAQVGPGIYALVDGGTCTIVGSGAMTDLAEGMANPLAPYRATLTRIVVADGVTSVGAQFFHKFRAITNVTMAASVTNVADYAFFRCESIDAIAFGAEQGAVTLGTKSIVYYLAITPEGKTYTVPAVTFNGEPPAMLGTETLENPKWELVEPGQEAKYHFFKLAPMK